MMGIHRNKSKRQQIGTASLPTLTRNTRSTAEEEQMVMENQLGTIALRILYLS